MAGSVGQCCLLPALGQLVEHGVREAAWLGKAQRSAGSEPTDETGEWIQRPGTRVREDGRFPVS